MAADDSTIKKNRQLCFRTSVPWKAFLKSHLSYDKPRCCQDTLTYIPGLPSSSQGTGHGNLYMPLLG